jgi:hypothetical protein
MSRQQPDPDHTILNINAEQALLENAEDRRLNGLVVTFHANERPLQGLAGWLDWRFQGAISSYLRAGALTGREGEYAYLPMTTSLPFAADSRVFHLILAGAGTSATPGARALLEEASLAKLRTHLLSLRLARLGLSRSDFGGFTDPSFAKSFKGVPLWIVQ